MDGLTVITSGFFSFFFLCLQVYEKVKGSLGTVESSCVPALLYWIELNLIRGVHT